MENEIKKCPYCGEEILKEAKKCKHCEEWLEEKTDKVDIVQAIETEQTPKNKRVEKENLETKNMKSVSDTGWTIVWKLALAIIGAIILANLFPNAFNDKIVLTNPVTGQEYEFPVETTKTDNGEQYCVKLSILEGDEHTFCSMDKDSITHFVKKVITKEMQMQSEMLLRGQDISSEITKFYSLDKMIYEPYKQQYNIFENNNEQPTEQQMTSDSVVEEKGDIIDIDEEEYNRITKETEKQKPIQKQVQPQSKPISKSVKQQETATQTSNVVLPQTKQNNQDIDDFMN